MKIHALKNKLLIIGYGLLLASLPIFLIGAGCQKNSFTGSKTAGSKNMESITILTDSKLKTDLGPRLQALGQESTTPIEIIETGDSYNLIVSYQDRQLPDGWQKKEIYKKELEFKPQSFSDQFKSKLTSNFTIYAAQPDGDKNLQIITDYLKESYSDNPPSETSITFVGDMMLSRTVEDKSEKRGDWNWPFLNIADQLKNADLVVGNMESPFSDPPKPFVHNTIFGADTRMTEGLKHAGINLVSLANNHFGDSGRKGMNLTFKTLTDNGIDYFGAGSDFNNSHQVKIKEINGIKFGFLGYSTPSVTPLSYASTDSRAGLNLMDIAQMETDVAEAKKISDYIIISMHAGTEYTPDPNKEQKEFAQAALKAGADFIYGHHPHVVQAIETYPSAGEKPIFYSLGNFVFDQEWSRETTQGLMVKSKFILDKLISLELVPIRIKNYGQSEAAAESEANQILERIYRASAE